MSKFTCEVLRIVNLLRNECCFIDSNNSEGIICKPVIRFERFHPENEAINNGDSKKKRKREEQVNDNNLIGLISISVRDEMLKESWLSSLSLELNGGKNIITHHTSLLNDLPVHSDLIHNQLVDVLFIEENCLGIHCPVEKEKDLENCRMELRALSAYCHDFSLNDCDWWSSDISNIACVKPEIKKTTLSGFISVETNHQFTQSNILERENCKKKIKIWICFLKNAQLISLQDGISLIESVSSKDRSCEISVNNQDALTVKESSFNENDYNRRLFHFLFSNCEKYGIKFTNLTTTHESNLICFPNVTSTSPVISSLLLSINIETKCTTKYKLNSSMFNALSNNLFQQAKNQFPDDLLSKQENKLLMIRKFYSPILSDSIASIINNSTNLNFRKDCLQILGIDSSEQISQQIQHLISNKLTN